MSESKGCSVVAVVLVAALTLVVGVAAGGGIVWFVYVDGAPAPVVNPEPIAVPVPVDPQASDRYAALLPLEETLRVEGPLPPKDVKAVVLGGKRFKLRDCYQKGVDRNPGLKGEMSLQFTVAQSNGHVIAAVERNTQFADKDVQQCILKEVKSWKFPPPKAQSVVKFDVMMMSMSGGDAQ